MCFLEPALKLVTRIIVDRNIRVIKEPSLVCYLQRKFIDLTKVRTIHHRTFWLRSILHVRIWHHCRSLIHSSLVLWVHHCLLLHEEIIHILLVLKSWVHTLVLAVVIHHWVLLPYGLSPSGKIGRRHLVRLRVHVEARDVHRRCLKLELILINHRYRSKFHRCRLLVIWKAIWCHGLYLGHQELRSNTGAFLGRVRIEIFVIRLLKLCLVNL